jgi:hypothetical protein
MLSKALEMGFCFHRFPAFWRTWRDAPFLGPLREAKISLFRENFYEELERYVKNAL